MTLDGGRVAAMVCPYFIFNQGEVGLQGVNRALSDAELPPFKPPSSSVF